MAAMMAAKPRSSEGCWTCRLRRKKCDEARPVCMGCAALEIDCLYSDAKPDWMDNGPKQKEQADLVKAEVKRKAAWRREKRYIQSIENGTEALDLTAGEDGEHIYSSRSTAAAAVASSSSSSSHDPFRRSVSRMSQASATPTAEDSGTDSSVPIAAADTPMTGVTPGSSHSGGNHVTPASSIIVPLDGPDSRMSTAWRPFEASLDQPRLDQERELSFIMMYLDYIFPFLYPFYRPSLAKGGRGWLLVLLMNNKAVFHSALSLTSYFWTLVLDQQSSTSHEHCKLHNLQVLQEQQELSLRQLQNDVREINERGVQGNLFESCRAMEGIINLLCFEVAVPPPEHGGGQNWPMHLDAALELFDQIMQHHSLVGPCGVPDWSQIMDQLMMYPALMDIPADERPWNTDQAALRFFTSILLHIDVVLSTALEMPPRLFKYHPHLIATPPRPSPPPPPQPLPLSCGGGCGAGILDPCSSAAAALPVVDVPEPKPALSIDEVMGVQNWALLCIAQTSALAAWKKEMAAAKKLSVLELVARAAPIETELRGRLACLAARAITNGGGDASQQQHAPTPFIPDAPGKTCPTMANLPPLAQHARAPSQFMFPAAPPPGYGADSASRIWGHAALTYLLVVVNGWQPASEAIRANVDATLALLAALPTPGCLRTVVWPFCVTGCLVSGPEKEGVCRALVANIGGLEVFGSVREALEIMEAVWARRDEIENGCASAAGAEWDLAKCFNILGRRTFLV